MTKTPQSLELQRRYDLQRTEAENQLTTAMLKAMLTTRTASSKYSDWLLLGTVAAFSFMIGNADKLEGIVSKAGFVWTGGIVCLACILGFVAKFLSTLLEHAMAPSDAAEAAAHAAFEKQIEDGALIEEEAEALGVQLDTSFRIDRVLTKFLSAAPAPARWLAKRRLAQNAGDPHRPQLMQVKALNRLHGVIGLQALLALCAILTAFGFAVGSM